MLIIVRSFLPIVITVTLGLIIGCGRAPLIERTRTDIPTSTRTGTVQDIRIAEAFFPNELRVKRGDEVRWINMRTDVVKIVFTDLLKEKVVCQYNFSGSAGTFSRAPDWEYQTQIKPRANASLCFREPGSYTYVARMASALPGGEKIETGHIQVGPEQRAE